MSRRHFACSSYYESNLTRRDLLRVGGLGMLGLTMPKLLKAGDQAVRKRWSLRGGSVVHGEKVLEVFGVQHFGDLVVIT